MSITPIKGDAGRADDDSSPAERTGVRARLRSWFSSVSTRVRTLFGRRRTEEVEESRTERGQIRVTGQRRLAPTKQTTDGQTIEDAPHRESFSGSTDVDAERDGDSLRVFNPNLDEAYITSDTWEEVEH